MDDSITVLMTTYNCAPYIKQAINSILNQTYKKFELLIIDDGSSDNTEEIVNQFNDSRIRYIKRNHYGRSESLNYGLKNASSDIIALMDADDICHPQRLEKQISILNKPDNVISCTWAAYFSNNKIRFAVKTPQNPVELKKKLAVHCYINHPSVMYNKNFILSNGGYNSELKVYEDYELWLRILDNVFFEVIPEYLVMIRHRSKSLSRQNFSVNKIIILNNQNKYYPLNGEIKYFDEQERIELLGWREFFYGDKNKARRHFINFIFLLKPRIALAVLLTLFPQKVVNIFLGYSFRYKILNVLFYFNSSFMELRKILKSYTKNI